MKLKDSNLLAHLLFIYSFSGVAIYLMFTPPVIKIINVCGYVYQGVIIKCSVLQ